MTDLFDIRRDFALKTLDEQDITSDPITFFEQWFNEAIQAEALEPNAMNLATATPDGRPSSRIVLLKQIKSEGFVFFTNYNSKKGVQLANNKYCALNFVWHELERQVRIEGTVHKISDAESDSYFEVRPTKSKLGAWASPQSKAIPNRQYLEQLVFDFDKKFAGKQILRPSNWGGYIVEPFMIEFWQGRKSRLHDRIQYTLTDGKWRIERLAP
ncbi:pyridoxamine 5'-phosphate oxidase [Dysgonomonas sp. PFB1-18]|uniref:pyridoxamine 5'-phosphate oxidase n=1 Tax=unclassified Dysgonomonas TaxID=2630389 RepID=UPI00247302A6|nr:MULTISPECIES: pyridoxamine 5'-phosphate oxidase [unclassified Dysgonomonas]MDH6307844.1 pyridoxamine 5'-phosphate oxidase [Dysgonomonas sp. PF1-14]MDH6337762.1 pyridoxamine 5'-phosphate oxidase [Dysgonomonas sp. PF1-16]MDH6378986.1 pyridoxamine 5'-phosphate oxidase [Dysgonomonas sp. PFB1-18]MDH6396621.1 pyridoxamine 5'-phosphate oxidase [Dysgonomonas sp. PF1-23]